MNILPKKRWHVRTRENMARVRRDEERVAAEEKEKERRTQLAEGEARNAALKQKSLLRSGQIIPVCEEPHRHINLFEDLEQGIVVSNATNADYEKEKKEEREKYEKQIGYLTYLGQDTVEATGCVSWYNKLPDRGSSGNDSKKKTLLGDPLNDIRRYLNLERRGRHENREEKRKCTENEKNAVRRAHKKSKKKTKKHERTKRTRSGSSSSSDSTTSAKCTDSKSISPKNANKLEQLRAQRLKREQEERKRSEALLARLRGEPELDTTKSDDVPAITQLYHSQFNPHLARQNKL
ncbi:Leukocyte receptor cluster member 1 [Cryptotermes secundus]|uniref:Leukocyte receptor cluster member 1 n=1 Tax=Cryptotermes secundus TaxID=105785 RepID=A0A2J7QN15_9NEOP|nr:leukocyte receptor cluster member 1 homolog [Cryptotermes secundus]PNF29980.1 Leukocyte receptor cluster member 1 [Cryptotermes secundus]